jgi:anti-anti-sigma factor
VGELDMANKARFERALTAAESYGHGGVLLDLENLVFMDSTGLSTLMTALKRAEDAGRSLQVRGARDEIRRLLVVSGLHWLLEGAAGEAQESLEEPGDWEPFSIPEDAPEE